MPSSAAKQAPKLASESPARVQVPRAVRVRSSSMEWPATSLRIERGGDGRQGLELVAADDKFRRVGSLRRAAKFTIDAKALATITHQNLPELKTDDR